MWLLLNPVIKFSVSKNAQRQGAVVFCALHFQLISSLRQQIMKMNVFNQFDYPNIGDTLHSKSVQNVFICKSTFTKMRHLVLKIVENVTAVLMILTRIWTCWSQLFQLLHEYLNFWLKLLISQITKRLFVVLCTTTISGFCSDLFFVTHRTFTFTIKQL